jgi:hypothetical protein
MIVSDELEGMWNEGGDHGVLQGKLSEFRVTEVGK